MIILDFYGLPGCGKSSISHELAKRLRKKGFKVVEPSWTLDTKYPTWRRITKKLLLSILYSLQHPLVSIDAVKGSGCIRSGVNVAIKQWVNISYTMYYLTRKPCADYMIMDEGIAQSVVSLFTEDGNKKVSEVYFNLRKSIKSSLVVFYIKTTKTLALERMKKRGTKLSRVDRLESNAKMRMLHRIEEICNELSNESFIVTNNSSIENVIVELMKTNPRIFRNQY